jgi:hypothetical protein
MAKGLGNTGVGHPTWAVDFTENEISGHWTLFCEVGFKFFPTVIKVPC